ncbi:MAG: alpha/beta fold hydrolase [Acetobacteraceae bacterium]|nr:alpha/beta fold hydrolase [Acetobacteraceae bacterium]
MRLPLDDCFIAYDLLGPEAAPVVCLAHSLAADGGMWAEQVPPLLAQGYRVLRLDMRGHGGSGPVPGDYTIRALAGDVARALEALGVARAHFIGLSIGGMIGQALAIEHGAKLASAMWCDTLPASPSGARETWRERMAAVREANSLAPLADATVERWLTDALKTRRPARWQQIRDTVLGTSPAGYLGCCAAILNFDFTAQLPSVRVPTLVVCGADDAGTPPAQNRGIAALVPGARYEEIAGARHFPNVEHPDLFNRIMLDWLKEQQGRA